MSLFDNHSWQLEVTDIDTYSNTVKLDGVSYPLSLAMKTLIPAYVNNLSPNSSAVIKLLKQLVEAGVVLKAFFDVPVLKAYEAYKVQEAKELAQAQRMREQQEERFKEINKTPEQWAKEKAQAEERKQYLRKQSELIRQAGSNIGRSKADVLAGLGDINWAED
ncbi:hypothetical protein MOV59_000046 [Proteus mirabilis]|uniref:hypothetical protein n=1 Tax=Proteus mirabilis TaxID=584 RepID=UPI001FADEDFE|nr:hypothetical protein [Proteus mirabilis]EKU6440736.1 hypothetical protein [Proteus mirabilis]EKU6778489.1 hypothetical protein [Proteus mirabilis]EKV5076186.1 hypothetical protein [Proteus mirabilis]EKX6520777.1 hypothetical protein [Proteus mirabilis]ELB1131787.1 hypothetical protein [Proteus mirabilis]